MVGKSGGLTLVCGSNNYRHKKNIYSASWWMDLIDQISCNHVPYTTPCKCILDIIIIIYTQTYVCACNCMHMDTCGASRWAWYYIVHMYPCMYVHRHTHRLRSQAINKHLWKLNSCTRHKQWKFSWYINIYTFRSWHSAYIKDTNDAARFWWYSLQSLPKWRSSYLQCIMIHKLQNPFIN